MVRFIRPSLNCGIPVLLVMAFAHRAFANDDQSIGAVDQQKYKACGVNALYECAGIYGRRVSFEQIYDSLRPGTDGTNTLAEIAAAAKSLGYAPVAANVTYDALVALPVPSIVHVRQLVGQPDGDHFIVYLGSTPKGEPVCLDAPEGPRILSQAAFNAKWTGNALFLCESLTQAGELRGRIQPGFWRLPGCWVGSASLLVVLVGSLIAKELRER